MNTQHVEIIFILDRSGSMAGLEEDTLGGYNHFIAEQAKKNDIRVTTVLFDQSFEIIRNQVNAEIAPLKEGEYFVRGSTALLDAIGRSVRMIIDRRVKSVENAFQTIFVITTDGMENASVHDTYPSIRQLITHCQEELGFKFVFLAANIDAAQEGRKMGMNLKSVHAYESTKEGTGVMFERACQMVFDIVDEKKKGS